jgi:hypothetical protein
VNTTTERDIMENNPSQALHVLQMISHICLLWMAALYSYKIYLLLQKAGPTEKAELKGDRTAGAVESLFNVLRPWSMESTQRNPYFYAEFMVFHVAVALTIGLTFFIPFTPGLLTPAVSYVFMLFMGLAFLIGLRRIHRRITEEKVRILTTPDDMFAVCLLTSFFAVGFITMLHWSEGSSDNGWMWLFFFMVCFFLIYVPFSKISHYVMYPFTRIMYGQIFGGRGILNKQNPKATWVPK